MSHRTSAAVPPSRSMPIAPGCLLIPQPTSRTRGEVTSAERVGRDAVLGNLATADQVLLDDAFEHGLVALRIPRALRVDDCDRPALADAEAVRLGAQDTALFRELQLLEPPLQEVPRCQTAFLVAAHRRRLVAAEKDVAARHIHA